MYSLPLQYAPTFPLLRFQNTFQNPFRGSRVFVNRTGWDKNHVSGRQMARPVTTVQKQKTRSARTCVENLAANVCYSKICPSIAFTSQDTMTLRYADEHVKGEALTFRRLTSTIVDVPHR